MSDAYAAFSSAHEPPTDPYAGFSSTPDRGGLGRNARAGFMETLTDTAGRVIEAINPVTPVVGMLQRGAEMADVLRGHAPEPLSPAANPTGARIGHALGEATGFQPEEVTASTPGERISRGVGAGLAGGLVPLGGGARTVAGLIRDLAIGAGSGAGSAGLVEAAPEPLKPVAGLVGGLLGGVATHGGLKATGAPLRAAGEAVGRIGEKMVAGVLPADAALTAEMGVPASGSTARQAAETLRSRATSPATVAQMLAQGAEEIVPGSRPTTFQATGDMGLGQLERQVATRAPDEFLARQAEQENARVGVLQDIQKDADPNAVATTLRTNLDTLDAETQAHVDSLTEAAQARAASLGGTSTPEALGADVRTAITEAETAARAREGALWRAIDPEGDLTGNMVGTREAAQRISGEIPKTAKPMAGEEAAIFEAARTLPALGPVGDLTALRSRLSTEMRNELIANGRSPTYARLAQLRGAIQDNLSSTIAHQVATEDAAVAQGALAAGESVGARIQAWVDDYRQRKVADAEAGGGAGPGAIAADAARGGAGPDGAGLPAARGPGGAAGDQGLPGGPPVTPAFRRWFGASKAVGGEGEPRVFYHGSPADKIGAFDPTKIGQREAGWHGDGIYFTPSRTMAESYRGETGGSITPAFLKLEKPFVWDLTNWDRQSDTIARIRKLFPELPPEAEAIGAAGIKPDLQAEFTSRLKGAGYDGVLVMSHEGDQVPVVHEAVVFEPTQVRIARADGDLGPTFDEAAAQRLAEATAATRERAKTFGMAPVSPVTAKAGPSDIYRLAEARTPEKFFHPGADAFAHMQALYAAVGKEAGTRLMGEYAAMSLRRAAMREDGTLDPARFARWVRAHDDALRALPPDIKATFSDAASAAREVAQATAQRAQGLKAAQAGALGRLIGRTEPEDVTRTVGSILGGQTAVADFRRLAQIVRQDPDAMLGLRQAVVDHMLSRVLSNAEAATTGVNALKGDTFQTFFNRARPALAQVFTPAEVDSMGAVARDVQRTRRSIAATKLPGGSNTPQDLAGGMGLKLGHGALRTVLNAFAAAGGFELHGSIGAVGALLGSVALQALRDAGVQRVDQLVTQAMLEPRVARALLQRFPEKPNVGAGLRLADALRRSAAATAVTEMSTERRREAASLKKAPPIPAAVAKPPGLVTPGNIDILARPMVTNPDGTRSTVRTISIGIRNGEVVIPTVIGDRVVSDREAIDHYRQTGEHLGVFRTVRDAERFAQALHEQQAAYYGG